MVCSGNGVNVSLVEADVVSVLSLLLGAALAPNNFGMGPIEVVLWGVGGGATLGCGVGVGAGAGAGDGVGSAGISGSGSGCVSAAGCSTFGSGCVSAAGCSTFGSAGGAEFNLFFLPQRAGT